MHSPSWAPRFMQPAAAGELPQGRGQREGQAGLLLVYLHQLHANAPCAMPFAQQRISWACPPSAWKNECAMSEGSCCNSCWRCGCPKNNLSWELATLLARTWKQSPGCEQRARRQEACRLYQVPPRLTKCQVALLLCLYCIRKLIS